MIARLRRLVDAPGAGAQVIRVVGTVLLIVAVIALNIAYIRWLRS